MFRTIIMFAIILASFLNAGAQKAFRDVANKYSSFDNYFASEVNRKTLNLYVKEKHPATNVRAVLETIDELKVLCFSTPDAKSVEGFIADVNKHYMLNNYSPFKVIRKGQQNQMVYLKEKENEISELLLLNTNPAKMSLVEIKGKIDLEKIVLLKEVLHIDGLESLALIDEKSSPNYSNTKATGYANKQSTNSKYSDINTTNNNLFVKRKGITVFDKYGKQVIDANNPSLVINGYKAKDDFQVSLSAINPNCIQSINVIKGENGQKPAPNTNGSIDILLKGDLNDLYTICEGTLYFGQNGFLQSIKIDDDCSPSMLFDCKEKPLSELTKVEPKKIKSIVLTANPRNCDGTVQGEYVVVESK